MQCPLVMVKHVAITLNTYSPIILSLPIGDWPLLLHFNPISCHINPRNHQHLSCFFDLIFPLLVGTYSYSWRPTHNYPLSLLFFLFVFLWKGGKYVYLYIHLYIYVNICKMENMYIYATCGSFNIALKILQLLVSINTFSCAYEILK